MDTKIVKFVKDWNNGANIGNSYIIVDIDVNLVEGIHILEVPRYDMFDAATKASALGFFVIHIIDAIKKVL